MSQRGRVLPLPIPGSPDRVYTVSELTQSIKSTLQDGFGVITVRGELTGLSRASSGHTYFSLKDAQSVIQVVLWADRTTQAIQDALQEGVVFQVVGDLTVYPKKGNYQIRALRVEPVGYGALQAKFEALKRKLELEGLFAPERKRELPRYPTRIGIVTSEQGAALQDLLRVLSTRAPYLTIILADTRVQGEGASQEIARGLNRMNAFGRVEVIVVGRGGGSPQDLWAFNEEPVIRAIVRSRIPVVSAVGHEVDITLADLAADVRAATPTHAAQLIVKDVKEIERTLLDLSRHARERIVRELRDAASRLRGIETHHALREPRRRIEDEYQGIDEFEARLSRALGGWVTARLQKTEIAAERLRSHAPSRSFTRARDRIESGRSRALQALASMLARGRDRVTHQERLLHSLDHHKVLERGYALIWDEEGKRLLQRGTAVRTGDSIEVQFFDARAGATVTKVVPAPPHPGKETS